MSASGVNSTGSSSSQSSTSSTKPTGYDALDTQAFMKLLISELSNQDPTQPMDSSQIVQQISQIRSIQATDTLTTSLQAVVLGQNMVAANSFMGHAIAGLSDDGKQVSGVVTGATVSNGDVKLYVGDSMVSLKNVQAVAPATSGTTS
jgi:flagellar hook assembly protein FlgD